jgi:hypothetical protein
MNKTLYLLPWSILKSASFLLIISLNCCGVNENPDLSILTDETPGVAVSHGLTKLTEVMDAKNITFERVGSLNEARGKSVIVTGLAYGEGTASQMLKTGNRDVPEVSEALTIWKTDWQNKPVLVIGGFDDCGLMYGILDVADRLGWSSKRKSPLSEVKEITEKPYVKERVVSMYAMNRTYFESRFFNEEYWIQYFDMLAENRINSFLMHFGYENGGFLAPCYPYFFDVDAFPDVRMVDITPEEQQNNLATLNHLIKLAHDRGIKFRVGIWNHIYRGGPIAGGGIPGAADAHKQPTRGLVWGVTTDNLISYTEVALAEFVKQAPDLDGIWFQMHGESGLKKGEQEGFWLNVFQTIKEIAPDLHLYFHSKGLPDSVVQNAMDVGVKFSITTKYWMEQLGMPYHPTHINRRNQFDRRHGYADWLCYPQQYKMHWRLWTGGTTRILLWGSPEYVRRFAESTHLYDGDGFDVNEPLATKMAAQPHDAEPFDLLNSQYRYYDYEFERYWHFYQVFGRVGYNPETSPDVWQKEFESRYGKKAGPLVETALHQASWILPRIVASCYPYSGFPTTRGWPERQRLGDLPVYARAEGSDIQQFANFDEEAQMLIEGGETAKTLPSASSQWFEQTSADINRLIVKAEKAVGNNRSKEFNSTITDLKILSNLALYHSRRIPAAVSYHLFERTRDVSALEDAIAYEHTAIEAWRQIVAAAADYYTDDLRFGIHLVKGKPQGTVIGDLDGHWKDDLVYLEKGITNLEEKLRDFKPEGAVVNAPKYKVASGVSYDKLFQISHQPVSSAPVDKALTVSVEVSAPAGVKWVRLRYRHLTQFEDYKTLDMEYDSMAKEYRAEIPVEFIASKWDLMYLIEVMDNNGNGRIYPDLNRETPYIVINLVR